MKIKHLSVIITFTITILTHLPALATGNEYWKTGYLNIIYQELVCKPDEPEQDRSPCNFFASNLLERGWGFTDFKNEGEYKSANQIAEFLYSDANWRALGSGDSQSTLTKAQEYANEGYPVFAVFTGNPNGHITIIIPGSLAASGSWGLNVPNSASFRLDSITLTYVGKRLSTSFRASDKSMVMLYARL